MIKIDPIALEVEAIRAAFKRGEMRQFYGQLRTHDEIARAERVEGGGYRFR